MREISEGLLRCNERQIRNEWFDGECVKATKVKKSCKNIEHEHRLQYVKHEEGNKERQHEKLRCKEVETLHAAKEIPIKTLIIYRRGSN